MVSVIIFKGMTNVPPQNYVNNIAQQWKSTCADSTDVKVHEGMENGYPVLIWLFECPLNTQTGKPESMYMKVISGRDSLYNVQYAYRSALSKQQVNPTMAYLKTVAVCDARRPESACPKGM